MAPISAFSLSIGTGHRPGARSIDEGDHPAVALNVDRLQPSGREYGGLHWCLGEAVGDARMVAQGD